MRSRPPERPKDTAKRPPRRRPPNPTRRDRIGPGRGRQRPLPTGTDHRRRLYSSGPEDLRRNLESSSKGEAIRHTVSDGKLASQPYRVGMEEHEGSRIQEILGPLSAELHGQKTRRSTTRIGYSAHLDLGSVIPRDGSQFRQDVEMDPARPRPSRHGKSPSDGSPRGSFAGMPRARKSLLHLVRASRAPRCPRPQWRGHSREAPPRALPPPRRSRVPLHDNRWISAFSSRDRLTSQNLDRSGRPP